MRRSLVALVVDLLGQLSIAVHELSNTRLQVDDFGVERCNNVRLRTLFVRSFHGVTLGAGRS